MGKLRVISGKKPEYERAEPVDSGQTPASSIWMKFAGPTIRITRSLQRSFLE